MKSIPLTQEINKQVGEQIEHIRHLKKKNVKGMMSALNLTESGYRNIERGITGISVVRLFQIAFILNVDYLSLLPYEKNEGKVHDENNFMNSMKQQVIENYEARVKQYKEENNFLKERKKALEGMLSKLL